MMNNKKIHTMFGSLLTLLAFMYAGIAQAADIASPEEALYKATQARMLSQRMVKNYTLAGLGVRARKAKSELESNVAQFETLLNELSAYASDDSTRANLRTAKALWEKAKPEILAAPSKDKVEAIREQSEALLQSCGQIVSSLSDHSQAPNADAIDLAGRQAMLSQRIAVTYSLMAWGFEDKYRSSYENTYKEFEATMTLITGLDIAAVDTAKSDAALKKIARQFKRVKPAKGDTFVPSLVDRSTEKLLDAVDTATKLYAGL